jgi:hypothetical protein
MARPYSEQFILSLNKADPTRAGVQLGKVCVKANLPITHVAKALDVSRMSVHSWFRGQYVREQYYERIIKFIDKVNNDIDNNILPAMSIQDAKKYLETIRIGKI